MPKTFTNEIDNTSGAFSSGLTNTVYIPGLIAQTIKVDDVTYSFTGLADGHTEADLLPHLLTSASELNALEEEFDAIYSTESLTETVKVKPAHGASFALAQYLLSRGSYVLFQIVINDTTAAWSSRFDELVDRGLYDPKFLCLGEFADGEATKNTAMIGCAEKRGDCIALVDHPQDVSSLEGATYAKKVHAWISANAMSSYVASFSPWCSNTMYKVDDNYPLLPPSFSFLAAYASSTSPSWLAAAGAFRGAVPGLVKVGVKYGEKDVDDLQCRKTGYDSKMHEVFLEGDNQGVACNPICNVDPFGIIIWGNRTGLNNGADGLKATSFLNIRNLACDVKKTMFKAARRYTFEQNTLRLWLNFCSQVRPLLDEAKTGEGISAYRFIQEETSAKARLKARVVIVPIEAVEDFELSFVLDDSIETEESVG